MAGLISNFSLFRHILNITCKRTCQLHQLAARLSSPSENLSLKIQAGAPVLDCVSSTSSPATIGGGWSAFSVRHKTRNYFPKPREHKRLQFTWDKRILTPGGRSILMRRILKGRHAIAHPPMMLPHWHHRAF